VTGAAIVVTGAGAIGSAGPGLDPLAAAFRDGAPEFSAIDTTEGFHAAGGARRAALIGKVSVADWIPPLKARRMSPPTRYAVVAGKMALAGADVQLSEAPDPGLGVVMATAFGPSSYTQRLMNQILDEGAGAASPALFTECVANAPAGQLAIQCHAAGPNYTLCNREVGGLLAVIRAAQDLRAGRALRMLAGSVDEMTPLLHAALDRFHALAQPTADAAERSRPFDARRDGCIAGEGAGTWVLERAETAAARGARVLGRVIGWGRAFDASAGVAGWGQGDDVLGAALSRALDRTGVTPGSISLIVSGASGSRAGDRLEARTLRRIWPGDDLPPVVAPKSVTGEYGGGLLASTALALRGDPVSTLGFAESDPACGLSPARAAGLASGEIALVTSLSAGGGAAWLVVERT
jgi:3-oxoacyl-[acyl-carrier-protein] synthase II